MTDGKRLSVYLNSLEQEEAGLLSEIGEEAAASFVPVIRRETGGLLRTLLALKRPERILEVGTATGYSALLMGSAMPDGCTITTIEKDGKRVRTAKENFLRAGMEGRITLLEGDAAELLRSLEPSFDFIFMDAAKGQYLHFLPQVLRLLCVGGVLVSDNVLQGGDILESRFAVARRNRTIHGRMRRYLHILTHMEGLRTSVLPVGDGVTVSVKTGETKETGLQAVEREAGEGRCIL